MEITFRTFFRTVLIIAAGIGPPEGIFVGAKLRAAGMHSLVGRSAPAFKVKSGDGRVMNRAKLRGKVTIIFYDTRKTAWNNRPLKRALEKKYNRLSPAAKRNIIRLPVIDCSGAYLTAFWRGALRKHSRKERVVIYGDWDGSMKSAFRMKAGHSNIIIIDSSGIIRYFKTGRLSPGEADAIIAFLKGAPRS